MKFKTAFTLLPLLALFPFPLAGGGRGGHPSRGTPAPAAGREAPRELRYGFTSEPATLDPLSPSNTADGRSILFNVFEGLVKPDTAGRLQPCAAESWTLEGGGLVYTFNLREGVLFHDGSPLRPEDVKFTLETAAEARFDGFTQIDRVEIPGGRRVRVVLREPDPEFLPYITIGIVKAGSADRERNAVGTGPYRIESYSPQRSLELRKFEGYWQPGLPRLERVSIVFRADSAALLLGLEGGGIDGATVTGAIARQLDRGRFDVVPGPSATVQLLALNNGHPPLDDIRVRRGINYGVDLRGIIDAAFYGQGEPSGSPLIPGLEEVYETALRDPYPADPARARALLAEAGYGDGPGQRPLSLEISVPSNYTMHVDTAQVLVEQLGKIGVRARIKMVDWATWLAEVYRGRRYEATIISLDANTVSPRNFLSRYRSAAGSNFINFKSAGFDRAYEAALRETGEAERAALYREAQRIISEEAASVYIQDILGFKAFRAGAYGGILNYPLYVIDFASMYGIPGGL
jgi:peptide/nickel transport system substrate-binding protein